MSCALYKSEVDLCVRCAGQLRTALIFLACQARRSAAVSAVSPTSTSPDETVAHTVLCQMCSRERGPAVRRLCTNLRTCCSLALPSCKRCLRVAFSKLPYESITPKYLNDVTLGKPSWDFACPSRHIF